MTNFQLPPPGSTIVTQNTLFWPPPEVDEEFCLRSSLQLMDDQLEAQIVWVEYLLFTRPTKYQARRLAILRSAKAVMDEQQLRPTTLYMSREDYDDILRWQSS